MKQVAFVIVISSLNQTVTDQENTEQQGSVSKMRVKGMGTEGNHVSYFPLLHRVAEMNFIMPTILVGMTNSYLPNRDSCLPNRDSCLPNRNVQIKGFDSAIPTE